MTYLDELLDDLDDEVQTTGDRKRKRTRANYIQVGVLAWPAITKPLSITRVFHGLWDDAPGWAQRCRCKDSQIIFRREVVWHFRMLRDCARLGRGGRGVLIPWTVLTAEQFMAVREEFEGAQSGDLKAFRTDITKYAKAHPDRHIDVEAIVAKVRLAVA